MPYASKEPSRYMALPTVHMQVSTDGDDLLQQPTEGQLFRDFLASQNKFTALFSQ